MTGVDGGALERLAEVNTVVFDKTGKLTMGSPVSWNSDAAAPPNLALAEAMAIHSLHPLARALAPSAEHGTNAPPTLDHLAEHPEYGLEALSGRDTFRLDRPEWALGDIPDPAEETSPTETVLSKNGGLVEVICIDNPLRPGAREAIEALKERGLADRHLSGERVKPVRGLAAELGLNTFEGGCRRGTRSSASRHGHCTGTRCGWSVTA